MLTDELENFAEKLKQDSTFQKDPKDWDQATRHKCRGLVDSLKEPVPPAATRQEAAEWQATVVGLRRLCEGFQPEKEDKNQLCIASDDPRLKGN